jgi:GntR family transcriptional regulator/MocR family aminotransferase
VSPRQLQAREILVRVDRSSGVPVGRQIEQQLRRTIRSGALAAGSGLPSTRALAEDLGVSRGVVVRAYAQLAAAGFIDVRQGANPRVRSVPHIERAPAPDGGGKILYDLRPDQSDVSTFPRRLWLRSVEHAVTSATNAELGYLDVRGLEQLRVEIASYLGRARGVSADPERILVTAGATHAMSLLAHTLARRGAMSAAFENPSHRILHAVARHAGLAPVGIPVDEHGLRTDMLGDEAAVVVSPASHFPSGAALPHVRRAALVGWARTTGGLVVENDYDAEFRSDRAALPSVQSLAPEEVAYIGSTGKTLAPAIRLGWVVLPAHLAGDVAEELSARMLHLSGIDQLAFADFLRRGELDRHLRRVRELYRRRRGIVVDALAKHLPDVFVGEPAAGLHVVVELPSADREPAVVAAARAAGVLVQSLAQHELPGYDGPAGFLLGFGSLPEPTIPLAVERLAAAVLSVR